MAPPKAPRAVQTPGDAPAAPAATAVGLDAFQADGMVLGGIDDVETVVGDSEVDALRRTVEAQARQIENMMAALGNLSRAQAAQTGRPTEAEKLPTMAEAQAMKSGTPVLTQDGWLVPATYGTPAASLNRI